MCTFVSVSYEIGRPFMMSFPLPKELAAKHGGKERLFVRAHYLGVLRTQQVRDLVEKGKLKEMYFITDWNEHHIVAFGGEAWVNDLLPFEDQKFKFEEISEEEIINVEDLEN